MAGTPPKPASATSPTTSNSAPIGGVPATTSARASPSSSIGDSSVGSMPVVASASLLPSENTGNGKTVQEEGEKLIAEILAIMISNGKLIKTHRQSVDNFLQSIEGLKDIHTSKDGSPLHSDDFILSMKKDKDIIMSEWELMVEKAKSVIPKAKEGNLDSIDDFIQVKNTLLQKLNNQATSVSLFEQKVDEFCSRLKK